MTLIGFRSSNHPQQVGRRGAEDSIDDRAIDPALFAEFDRRFRFTIDVAATADNARCDRYFDRDTDGLAQTWAGERVWCNPPYSAIEPWVRKAWDEHIHCPVIVMLLPANRTEQRWWTQHVEPYRDLPASPMTVDFLPGRIRFLRNGRKTIRANERPPFGCCLVAWNADHARVYRPWRDPFPTLFDGGPVP